MSRRIRHWVWAISLLLSLTTFDWGAWTAATAGFTAETLTTRWGITNGCHETNQRVFGLYPSNGRLLAGETVRIGALSLVMWIGHHIGHHTIEKWIGYGAGGFSGGLAALNVQRCGV